MEQWQLSQLKFTYVNVFEKIVDASDK